MKLPLVGPSYALDSRTYDGQRCINLYPEGSEVGTSKEIARLVGTPGLELLLSLGDLPSRGCITTAKGRCFFVSGNVLFEIFSDWSTLEMGTLNTSAGRVSLSENGFQLLLVDGQNGYILDFSDDEFGEIEDENFPNGATVCAFLDTYFIVNVPSADAGQYAYSDNYDGSNWSALDLSSAESSPDNISALLADHGQLAVFGSRSGEVHYNSGDDTSPFIRVQDAVMQTGCAAAHTLKSFDNTIMWLGTDEFGRGVIWSMTDAYRPERVSNQALEKALSEVSSLVDAYALVYHQRGHAFYMLSVPEMTTSWVFDAATKMWHERSFYNADLGREELHLANCHTFFNQSNLVGDRRNGNIYRLRLDYYTDNGEAIHRRRVTPPIANEGKLLFFPKVHLDLEPGVGLIEGQGSDPKVMMRYSNDGGYNWSFERTASFGKMGNYNARALWTQCGSARNRVFEFKITDPVPVSMIGLYAEMIEGAH